MALQTGISILIILGATAYILRYGWRIYKGKSTGCHCEDGACSKETTKPE